MYEDQNNVIKIKYCIIIFNIIVADDPYICIINEPIYEKDSLHIPDAFLACIVC